MKNYTPNINKTDNTGYLILLFGIIATGIVFYALSNKSEINGTYINYKQEEINYYKEKWEHCLDNWEKEVIK